MQILQDIFYSEPQFTYVKLAISLANQSFVSLKHLPAMRETWVRSQGWEDPLEKGTATHSSILAWRIPWTVESDTTEQLSLSLVP